MGKMFLVSMLVALACIYGWIANIAAIVHSGPIAEWSGMIVARVIGVFFVPLGVVLGYF